MCWFTDTRKRWTLLRNSTMTGTGNIFISWLKLLLSTRFAMVMIKCKTPHYSKTKKKLQLFYFFHQSLCPQALQSQFRCFFITKSQRVHFILVLCDQTDQFIIFTKSTRKLLLLLRIRNKFWKVNQVFSQKNVLWFGDSASTGVELKLCLTFERISPQSPRGLSHPITWLSYKTFMWVGLYKKGFSLVTTSKYIFKMPLCRHKGKTVILCTLQ